MAAHIFEGIALLGCGEFERMQAVNAIQIQRIRRMRYFRDNSSDEY